MNLNNYIAEFEEKKRRRNFIIGAAAIGTLAGIGTGAYLLSKGGAYLLSKGGAKTISNFQPTPPIENAQSKALDKKINDLIQKSPVTPRTEIPVTQTNLDTLNKSELINKTNLPYNPESLNLNTAIGRKPNIKTAQDFIQENLIKPGKTRIKTGGKKSVRVKGYLRKGKYVRNSSRKIDVLQQDINFQPPSRSFQQIVKKEIPSPFENLRSGDIKNLRRSQAIPVEPIFKEPPNPNLTLREALDLRQSSFLGEQDLIERSLVKQEPKNLPDPWTQDIDIQTVNNNTQLFQPPEQKLLPEGKLKKKRRKLTYAQERKARPPLSEPEQLIQNDLNLTRGRQRNFQPETIEQKKEKILNQIPPLEYNVPELNQEYKTRLNQSFENATRGLVDPGTIKQKLLPEGKLQTVRPNRPRKVKVEPAIEGKRLEDYTSREISPLYSTDTPGYVRLRDKDIAQGSIIDIPNNKFNFQYLTGQVVETPFITNQAGEKLMQTPMFLKSLFGSGKSYKETFVMYGDTLKLIPIEDKKQIDTLFNLMDDIHPLKRSTQVEVVVNTRNNNFDGKTIARPPILGEKFTTNPSTIILDKDVFNRPEVMTYTLFHEMAHKTDIDLQGLEGGFNFASENPAKWANKLVSKIKNTKAFTTQNKKQALDIDPTEIYAHIMTNYYVEKSLEKAIKRQQEIKTLIKLDKRNANLLIEADNLKTTEKSLRKTISFIDKKAKSDGHVVFKINDPEYKDIISFIENNIRKDVGISAKERRGQLVNLINSNPQLAKSIKETTNTTSIENFVYGKTIEDRKNIYGKTIEDRKNIYDANRESLKAAKQKRKQEIQTIKNILAQERENNNFERHDYYSL